LDEIMSRPAEEKQRIRMALLAEYDGTDFSGFQRQNNGRSVQQVLEKALGTLYGRPVSVYGCSRTDAGVHARAHVSHADVPFLIPPEKLPLAMNTLLPADVSVLKASVVTGDFHARFSSQGKEYVYRIWNSSIRPAMDRKYIAHVPGRLDHAAMKTAAAALEGRHDFSAFFAQTDKYVNPVRTMDRIRVSASDDSPLIEITVRGKSFLYNMVRILAGTIVYAGQGKIDPMIIGELIEGKDRRYAGKTMPARGLTLEKVFYDPDPFSHGE
jgi:tRNA pseudouridine38-40 synthase